MAIGVVERQGCPLCDSHDTRLLCELGYRQSPLNRFLADYYGGRVPLDWLRDACYRVVICRRCGFIYQDRILNDDGMQLLYREWIDAGTSLRKLQRAGASRYRKYAGQIMSLSRVLEKTPSQCRILDFGMGWGYWSRMAQAHGYRVDGLELSPERSAHARSLGVNSIDRLPRPGPHYHCIHASQVFEHLAEPRQTLGALCARLAPGGIVYLRVPDGRGIEARLAGSGWSPDLDAIHPLEHINCFTRRTLIALGATAGLAPIAPPLRLGWPGLWGGIRREIADRFLTTHVLFGRQ